METTTCGSTPTVNCVEYSACYDELDRPCLVETTTTKVRKYDSSSPIKGYSNTICGEATTKANDQEIDQYLSAIKPDCPSHNICNYLDAEGSCIKEVESTGCRQLISLKTMANSCDGYYKCSTVESYVAEVKCTVGNIYYKRTCVRN